ncbi:molybdopterin oxidoreductase family protein [Streptomonospora sediminis]
MAESRKSVCPLCEAMCALRVDVHDDRIVGLRGDPDDPLSRGHICPKAFALQDVHDDPDRLRTPVRRGPDGWTEISWDDALDLVAEELARIRREHGADAVAVYQGNPVVHSLGSMTHGPAFVRTLATRNRYSATSLDQLPHQIVAHQMYGNQWLLPVPDIDRTDHLLVLGANPVVSNGSIMTAPGFGRRLTELRKRGGRLVVVDPRRTETARRADAHHPIRPGTDAALLFAMAHVILREDLARPAHYIGGIAKVVRAVEPFTPERAAAVTGIAAGDIRRLARAFATAPSAACYGRMGVSTQRYGVLCQWGIQLLNALTGNLDRPGGTLLTAPAIDPIRNGAVDPGSYGRWASRVRGLPEIGGELPAVTLADEIRSPGSGQVRALLTVAGNPVLSVPGGTALAETLPGLDFMAAIDFYINETTRHADVILPPTDALERDHYDLVFHLLAVRNTARYAPALFPKPDTARHDWQIFAELGRRYRSLVRSGAWTDWLMLRTTPARIVDLGLRFGPYRLSLRRLRRSPNGRDLGALRPSLPGRLRTRDRRVRGAPPILVAAADRAATELLDPPDEHELLLVGRRQTRGNNSWLHNTARLVSGRPRHHLLMHPDDMRDRGIPDGGRARVRSRSGELVTDVRATTDLMRGVVSLPHGFGHDRPGVRLSTARRVAGESANDVTDPLDVDETGATAILNGFPVTVRCE